MYKSTCEEVQGHWELGHLMSQLTSSALSRAILSQFSFQLLPLCALFCGHIWCCNGFIEQKEAQMWPQKSLEGAHWPSEKQGWFCDEMKSLTSWVAIVSDSVVLRVLWGEPVIKLYSFNFHGHKSLSRRPFAKAAQEAAYWGVLWHLRPMYRDNGGMACRQGSLGLGQS